MNCPIRTQLYGGIPSGGGYHSWTEYEIGAQFIAEAAHCILGSLGRRAGGKPGWLDVYYTEQGHIDEENDIIKSKVQEYSKAVYTKMIAEGPYVEKSVESIKRVSPKLVDNAKRQLSRWQQQKDVPSGIQRIGMYAYHVLIDLAEAMLRSVSKHPSVTNAFRDTKLKYSVALLDSAVDQFDRDANKITAEFRKSLAASKKEPAVTASTRPVSTRDKRSGESDIDYVMYLLGWGSQRESLAEQLIDSVLQGATPRYALHSVLSGSTSQYTGLKPSKLVENLPKGIVYVKSFFDGFGKLRFATEDDVLIDPSSDNRLSELVEFADNLSADNPLLDVLDGYEGTLDSLYRQVTTSFHLAPTG